MHNNTLVTFGFGTHTHTLPGTQKETKRTQPHSVLAVGGVSMTTHTHTHTRAKGCHRNSLTRVYRGVVSISSNKIIIYGSRLIASTALVIHSLSGGPLCLSAAVGCRGLPFREYTHACPKERCLPRRKVLSFSTGGTSKTSNTA